ncbi:hypothetical protein AYO20_09465 [Fonsecaea nubica]|uniref:MutL C-terminal dimerisation domain-containing protein n=1 Tax=Fonsecaea nubica TaxID=856822 RepID=A0A178CEE1_9EURO|nr:hypothetical protein AYO20_09465 [Fonsecaea nubica]OAL28348.1 hypothetical protein AYO20_09465 [Fonsecaea nubica]
MAEGWPRISLLPADISTKVSSSSDITSSEHVIEGLFRNALDADASSVVIEVEFSKGYIWICDNGIGIQEVEFSEQGQLARLHCSSKLNCSPPTYGCYGRFLSNLSHLSLLSIASEHRSEVFANRLILHRGNAVCRQLRLDKQDVGIMRKGTAVTVHDLFSDLPARAKHLSQLYASSTETEKAFNRVKEMLAGYLLAQSRAIEVRFSVKGARQHRVHFRSPDLREGQFSLESTVSILFQARLVNSVDITKWRLASARTKHFRLRAAISVERSPNKSAQYISIGKSPIQREGGIKCVFDGIDQLYQESTFGSQDFGHNAKGMAIEDQDSVDRSCQTNKLPKAVDKWPMFYIQIEPRTRELSTNLALGQPVSDVLPVFDHLTRAIESLISNFLNMHGYSACAERNASKRVRRRHNRGIGPCQQLVGESANKPSKLATEARYLSHWRRVKSARPSPEDFRYGLGLRNSDDVSCSSLVTKEGRLSVDPSHKESDPEDATRETQSDFEGFDETFDGVPWISWRGGQVTYVHPRTGAVIPPANGDTALSYPDHGVLTRIQGPELPRTDDSAKPLVNLQPYLPAGYRHQSDAPIACIISEQGPGLSGKVIVPRGQDNTVLDSRIVTKGSLSRASIVQQVDRKFILAVLAVRDTCDPYFAGREQRRLLVLIDQHAADERIKFEKLCEGLCKRISTNLAKPLVFEVDETEARLLEEHKGFFRRWSVIYHIVESTRSHTARHPPGHRSWTVEVTVLPTLIIERCRADPKLLADIMRSEIWLGRARRCSPLPRPPQSDEPCWWSDLADCPKGMIEMLKSRSCRTAVMFNDHLDKRQCHELVQRLSQCTLPFQCAHGRPTLTILADLGGDVCGFGMDADPSIVALGFGDAWRGWVK